jgi:hypothetical protein
LIVARFAAVAQAKSTRVKLSQTNGSTVCRRGGSVALHKIAAAGSAGML